jgi:hypothetical protein
MDDLSYGMRVFDRSYSESSAIFTAIYKFLTCACNDDLLQRTIQEKISIEGLEKFSIAAPIVYNWADPTSFQ